MIKTMREAMENMDDREPREGWAPGKYMCKCCHCGDVFVGHKRAVSCAPCAYAIEGEVVGGGE